MCCLLEGEVAMKNLKDARENIEERMYVKTEEHHNGKDNVSFYIVRHQIDQDPMRRILRDQIWIVNAENNFKNNKEEYFRNITFRSNFVQNQILFTTV